MKKFSLSEIPRGLPVWVDGLRFTVADKDGENVMLEASMGATRVLSRHHGVLVGVEQMSAAAAKEAGRTIVYGRGFYTLCGDADNTDLPLKDVDTGYYATFVSRLSLVDAVV